MKALDKDRASSIPMIKILFFGSIADRLGKRECSLAINTTTTIADVVENVGCTAFKPLLLAVNQTQINDMHTIVQANDEVAMMPPFSGG